MRHLLSKSKYIRGLQCEKALWLDVHNPRLAWYPAETLEKFRQGRGFERTFKDTFPEGIDVSARLRGQIDRYPDFTRRMLERPGEVTLFEAGFLYDDVLVLADVLCKHADGAVEVYEVKNGRAVSDTFRHDVGIQQYVIGHALPGLVQPDLFCDPLRLEHFYILYNDGTDGFVREDLLSPEAEEGIAERVSHFKQLLQQGEPSQPMGDCCHTPYDCPYQRYCRRQKE